MRFFAIMFTSLILFVPVSAQNSDDAPPPYLYYYSRMLGGIIVERADSTDSRHIGADVIPAGFTGLAGPGWSPSGRFFAAHTLLYGSYTTSSGATYVIDVNGGRQPRTLSIVTKTYRMEWSPGQDEILLVIGSVGRTSFEEYHYFIWLFDPAKDSLLAEFGIYGSGPAYALSEILWELENRQISFYLLRDLAREQQYFHVTMRFDGTVLKEPTTEAEFRSHYIPPEIDSDDNIYDGIGTSPSGRYEVMKGRPSVMLDHQTDTAIELPRHSQGTVCRGYEWSADETYIITRDGTLIAGGGCGDVVLGVTDNQGELWRELGGCSWSLPPCIGWLPPQVDVNTLPPGQPKPIQLESVGYEIGEPSQMPHGSDWSILPDLRLRCTDQTSREIFAYESGEILYNLVDDLPCIYPSYATIPDEGIQIVVAPNSQHNLLATYHERDAAGVRIWQLCDGVGIRIKQLNTYGYDLEFSSDGEQLKARNNSGGWKIYSVADILASAEATCEALAQ